MHPRGSSARARRHRHARTGGAAALAMLLALVAGCSHGASSGNATNVSVTKCGSTKSAAGVPVRIEVIRGSASCGTALLVEKAYAAAIRSGRAPGNGGGGPVKVDGWTCKGFATPIVLRTGNASECTHGSDAILAILELPQSPSS